MSKNKNKSNSNYLVPIMGGIIVLLIICIIVILLFKNNNEYFNRYTKEAGFIASEEAIDVVLDDINIKEHDVKDLDVELDYKYGKDVYEINFNYQNYEYEYYVDAKDGSIVKSFKEKDDDVILDIETDSKEETHRDETTSTTKYITREDALTKAFNHAKISQSKAYDIDIELDYKFGKEVYEIDFNYQNYEYQYYIDALTGDIVNSFKEFD